MTSDFREQHTASRALPPRDAFMQRSHTMVPDVADDLQEIGQARRDAAPAHQALRIERHDAVICSCGAKMEVRHIESSAEPWGQAEAAVFYDHVMRGEGL